MPVLRRWLFVVDSLLIFTPIVGFCIFSMFCGVLLYAHYSIATILMGKRELVNLLCLFPWCLVIVVWLFLTMPTGLSAFCDCGISWTYSHTIFER